MKYIMMALIMSGSIYAKGAQNAGIFNIPGRFLNSKYDSNDFRCDEGPYIISQSAVINRFKQNIGIQVRGTTIAQLNDEWSRQCNPQSVYTTSETDQKISEARNSFFESVAQKISTEMGLVPEKLEKSESFKSELRDMIRKIVKEEMAAAQK